MTAPSGYSQVTDLLVGDVALGSTVDPQKFVNDAAKEVNSALGSLYVVPIIQGTCPVFVWDRLVKINNHIASARLLMSVGQSGEETSVHAYALRLLTDAMGELEGIAKGVISLPNTPLTAVTRGGTGTGPSVLNYDAQSATDAAYEYLTSDPLRLRPYSPYEPIWRPGSRGGFGLPATTTPNAEPRTGYIDPVTGQEIDDEGNEAGLP